MKIETIYSGAGEYLGKTMCGFVNSYNYNIEITKDLYGYTVQGITNLTEEKKCSGCLQYASEISLRRNWMLNESTKF